ncbi:MAG TPA: hypothetical protein VHN99_11375, partial [Deinococcales bacterium]|nr:hypothetical protein [Deinococcales bacterium]
VAHAAGVLAGFWDSLGEPGKAEPWRAVAAEHAALTERLWTGERYADRDARQGGEGTPTGVDDPMLFTPWALGVAEAAHAAAGRERLAKLDGRGEVWPMFVWVTTEAAWALGEKERAAELAAAVIERAYARWDAREPVPGRAQPGVASEYWPHDRPSGGEGYGWGAFTTHLLFSTLLGYRPEEDALTLTPNLPAAWRQAGRTYGARLTHHGRPVAIRLEPLDGQRLRLKVNGRILDAAWGEAVRLNDRDLNP